MSLGSRASCLPREDLAGTTSRTSRAVLEPTTGGRSQPRDTSRASSAVAWGSRVAWLLLPAPWAGGKGRRLTPAPHTEQKRFQESCSNPAACRAQSEPVGQVTVRFQKPLQASLLLCRDHPPLAPRTQRPLHQARLCHKIFYWKKITVFAREG